MQEDDPHGPEMRQIPLTEIDTNPYQPRTDFNEVALQELVASVLEHGILQPIIVRMNGMRYQLVSGERRFQAARRAGMSTIPAVIRTYDERTMAEIAIVENVQREDISPLEAAEAYKRLMDEFGLTQEQVALRVGKSRPSIANTLRLLRLPENIRESLACGDITEGHARSLLSISDPEWRERVWRRIVDDNLSVRDTERLSRSSTPSPAEPNNVAHGEDGYGRQERGLSGVSRETRSRRAQNADLNALEERLRRLLGTRVRISGRLEAGRIIVDFYGAEDLERIANLLGII